MGQVGNAYNIGFPGNKLAASEAQMEAESSGVLVSADQVLNANGVAKAHCVIEAAGTLRAGSYNVASITDVAAGQRVIVWATDFASALYTCVGSIGQDTAVGAAANFDYTTFAAGSIDHRTWNNTTLTDWVTSTVAFGDR